MFTDRKLLKLAAKAAGHGIEFTTDTDGCQRCWFENRFTCIVWEPLDNDGDALRLEVVLKATSAWEPMRGGWSVGAIVNGEFKWLAFHEDRNRATTMAAAEIGRKMKNGEVV